MNLIVEVSPPFPEFVVVNVSILVHYWQMLEEHWYLWMLSLDDLLMWWILLDGDVGLYRRNVSMRLDRPLTTFRTNKKIFFFERFVFYSPR